MAGVLIHVAVGLLSAVAVHLKHFRLEFSLAVFLGNLLPDVIKFGISALKQGTAAVFYVRQDGFFNFLNRLTSNSSNWFTLGFFALLLITFLYHYHIIKKKKLWEYEEIYVFLVIGIITHLVLDALLIENGFWF